MSGVSKCGWQRSTSHEGFRFHHTQRIWKALNSCGINHEYISLLKKIYKDQKASVQMDVEINMFEIGKGTKWGDLLSSLLFNTVLQNPLKEVAQRLQKKKGMEICVSDHDHDCLTNFGLADDVLLFATSKEQFQKMLCEFKNSSEKWDSGSTQERRKFSATKARTQKKKVKSLTLVEILAIGESVRYLGQQITFQHQETTEIRNRIRAAWTTFHKYRQVPITLMRVFCLVFSVIVPAVSNDTWIQRNSVEANFCCFHRISVFGVRFHVVKNRLLQDTSQD